VALTAQNPLRRLCHITNIWNKQLSCSCLCLALKMSRRPPCVRLLHQTEMKKPEWFARTETNSNILHKDRINASLNIGSRIMHGQGFIKCWNDSCHGFARLGLQFGSLDFFTHWLSLCFVILDLHGCSGLPRLYWDHEITEEAKLVYMSTLLTEVIVDGFTCMVNRVRSPVPARPTILQENLFWNPASWGSLQALQLNCIVR
jgi:hypothetical protein